MQQSNPANVAVMLRVACRINGYQAESDVVRFTRARVIHRIACMLSATVDIGRVSENPFNSNVRFAGIPNATQHHHFHLARTGFVSRRGRSHMNIMGHQHIIGRLPAALATFFSGAPQRRTAILAALGGLLLASECVAASRSPDIDDSTRKVRESAARAAAHAKARYPRKPAASSDTAKALGMTDAELTSWLTDIRQQAASPILRSPRDGDVQLHPTRSARPTDS
ncbi:hypothetical protein L0U95_30735 (plasmid) [Burkholderia cenocepacia]|uniref:hypothetical protein n=1 Tax=Burkholderia cenocepacia TaxID=95486 RepID=UPI001F15EBCB|nr:hypothetical protein [Burkholderia cenocepacia]UJH76262.1 hypothetical protein L0U95_30735 [Burkholderia cenocepacia]